MTYTGKDLVKWGFKPGPWFKDAIEYANRVAERGATEEFIRESLTIDRAEIDRMTAEREARYLKMRPALNSNEPLPFNVFLEPENHEEGVNLRSVVDSMSEIMRVPVVKSGAVMPDACPAGTIPVGGIVGSAGIHPNYHSADVCCSMAMSVFNTDHSPKELLDKIQELTHFGPSKREIRPVEIDERIFGNWDDNIFLKDLQNVARWHFTTQGDGNHFYFVGHLESNGKLAIVSHHGSRGLGARVFKRGRQAAEAYTKTIAPSVPKQHAWLDPYTDQGRMYWKALQTVRRWTKLNHFMLHAEIAKQMGGEIEYQVWNPHNFVFQRDDVFYHAKGATPSYSGHSRDDTGVTLIPMNMAEPILITKHTDNLHALGFAPHGAGRNVSRTQFLKENAPTTPEGIDARFWTGKEDKSELPEAYKSAAQIVEAIKDHNLAEIVDRVIPYGSIMAGEVEEFWKKGKS